MCVLLAGSAVVRRGLGSADGAFAELLVVLAALAVLAYVWPGRNFDAAQLNVKLHQTWALGFTRVGDLPEAEMHLRDVLWLQPHDPETLVALANVLLADTSLEKSRSREQAVAYYEAALRLKPDYAEARQRLNQTLQELGRKDNAAQ